MPQETNLNVSPYFDDFDKDKEYYKVLFKPGYPIQARELTTLQSILQNQIEQYGRHIFKEGSVVIPGQLRYESPFYAVELNPEYNGLSLSLYFNQLVGKRIRGESSGVTAEVVHIIDNIESERNNYTLYVKYLQSGGADFNIKRFQNNETLLLETPIVYNNISIQSGQGFCNTIVSNAISEGSSVSVADGVYFVRGIFATVKSQTIILGQYNRNPSYKVGFNVIEKIVTADEDENLYDNAQGFSNYAAPGADRFQLSLELTKKDLNDTNTENFVEILRVDNGIPQFFNKNAQYNLIRDELARRTYDESGDYYVKPFSLAIRDCLNDKVLNYGIYFKDQLTLSGRSPSEDTMIYQISPGKAYVNGYDVETISARLLEVPKARTTSQSKNFFINFNAGSLFIVNNAYGSPRVGMGTTSVVKLMNSRIGSNKYQASGTEIGSARIYDFVPETDYVDETSRLHLRLFDIETYTSITLSQAITLNSPAVIKGKRSKARGYLKENVSGNVLTLYGVSGNFLENEPISINEIDNTRLITSVTDYSISDIKSLYSNVGISTFNADVIFNTRSYISTPGTTFNINNGVVSSGLKNTFTNYIKVGDIVSYASTSYSGDPIYNKVTNVGAGGTFFQISSITSVPGICNGSLPSGNFNVTNVFKLYHNVSSVNSSLLTKLYNNNINNVGITETEILQRRSFSSIPFQNYSITINIDPLDEDVYFESFDEDRFVITYSDGSIEPLRFDKYFKTDDGKSLTFYGLSKQNGTADVIATVVNTNPSSKTKKLNKATTLIVSKSKFEYSGIGSTTLNDGLSYSNVYGTRVHDEEICLNVPDVVRVLGIYESLDTEDPQIPYLQLTSFTGVSNNNQDYIIGETIVGSISGSVALVVDKKDNDKIEYVYLNTFEFSVGEIITGENSKVQSVITSRPSGDKNITQNYTLDNGQRKSFYDYGRIVRKPNAEEPQRKIKIIYQNYTIDSSDTGEIITANSYPVECFKHDVPYFDNSRLTDYIDIRPRVSTYTSSNKSPFEFNSRTFASDGQYSDYIIAPDENLAINYSYYQGRIDLLTLNPDGTFEVVQGTPSDFPIKPSKKPNCLDISYIYVPPYVYDIKNVSYDMIEHKRYRMSDIALLENRIERVEKYTTLSMLESKTENFKIKDAETGLDRFKCGFFVDNFSNHLYHDVLNPNFRSCIDTSNNTLRPTHYTTALDLQLGSEVIENFTSSYSPLGSHSFPSDLGSLGVKKTGDLITLNYDEVLYFEQPYATKTESVTPFLVRYWTGFIELRPPLDTWIEERVNITNSFNEVISVSDPLPDINVTLVENVSVNNEVNTSSPTPQTGVIADSFDWITNARNILSSMVASSTWLGGMKIRLGSDLTKDSEGRAGANGFVNSGKTLHLEVWKNRVTSADISTINKLLPPDIAQQFITQIRSSSDLQRSIIEFTPGVSATFKEETITTVSTTTSSESNTVTTVLPPEITESISTSETTSTRSEVIRFLRSRNIEFDVKGLRPVTKFYAFFEGIDVQKYIIPKLLEVEMISGKFEVGETVESSPTFVESKFRFRLCNPNHKFGPFNNPSETFKYIPYNQQVPPTGYSETSTFLNVDTNALQLPSEVDYYGVSAVGMTLIGKTSGAVARISNIRLISDSVGRLIGSLFIPDPNKLGNPQWINGENTFTVIDTPTLDLKQTSENLIEEVIANSRINESSGETEFVSSGTVDIKDVNILTTRNISIIPSRNINTTTITNTTTTTTTNTTVLVGDSGTTSNTSLWETSDPLAQSFYVSDESGIFLTSVDIYFETKDEELPVTLQIRPMIAGVPSNVVVPFSEVTLTPDQVNVSTNGSVVTNFKFPSPVYLNGPRQQEIRQAPVGSQQTSEYSIVLLSGSPNYRVFIAQLGQYDILRPNVMLSQQPTLGSLFKSQNGSTWSPSQLEDLKYRIYRANFTSDGIVRFFNPKLSNKNKKVTVTGENQFVLLSKKNIIGINSSVYNSDVRPGVIINQNNTSGRLVSIAGSISVGSGVTISNPGTGYTVGSFSGVELITETGYGSGAIVTINTNSDSEIGSVSVTNGGSGYQVGDSLIVPEIGIGVGYGGKLTVTSIGSSNTFIIDEIQGNFSTGIGISYTNSLGITSSIGAGKTITSTFVQQDQYYTGNHMKVYQINHCMHSPENYVLISKFRPNLREINTRLSSDITSEDISIPVSSGTGINFINFEGKPVDENNLGYVIVGEEVIGYSDVQGDILISSTSLRGVDGTEKQPYNEGTILYKYELNGISLRRINKKHNLSLVNQEIHKMDLNSYHIKIEMGDIDSENANIGSDRSNDLYFRKTLQTGDIGTNITNNIQFEVLTPSVAHIVLPSTSLNTRVRTFSGTSVGGNEKSFIDQGFEEISLNSSHYFDSPRLICSDVNEQRFISESPGNRSFTMEFLMNTRDSRVSPIIDTIQSSIILTSNLVNNPIGIDNDKGYADDDSVRSLTKDNHSTIYLSKPINLKLPANSIKVIFSAIMTDENDIRVLYQTFRTDVLNSGSTFDLFPGASNYKVDGQGIKRIIDFSQNNGSSDFKVNKTGERIFKDYEYSVDDLPDFDAFAIKIVMASKNQANPPLIKDLRAIATVKPRI